MNDPTSGRRCSAPTQVLVAVPELTATHSPRHRSTQLLRCRHIYCSWSRRRGEKWSSEGEPVRLDRKAYWRLIDSLCESRQKIWVFSPSAGELLTLTRTWDLVARGWLASCIRLEASQSDDGTPIPSRIVWMGRHCINPRCTVVSLRRRGTTVQWVGVGNYGDWDWRSMAQSVKYDLPNVVKHCPVNMTVEPEPHMQCGILHRWVRTTIGHWVLHRYGPWRETAATLSVSLWRTVDGPSAASRHHNDDARSIESQATHGGRAHVWYYGSVGDRSQCPKDSHRPPSDKGIPHIPGPVYSYDIASMYPYLLGAHEYPTQLRGVVRDVCLERAKALLLLWGGIATVTVRVRHSEYPHRHKGEVTYPTGQFTTTLAGIELQHALEAGEVIAVHSLCTYKLGRPFVGWSQAVLYHRQDCKRKVDLANEYLWKGIGNSFSGKFAQRSTSYKLLKDVIPPEPWGDYRFLYPDGSGGEWRRAIAGVAYRKEDGLPGHRLPTAVYCYLTAYGRHTMRLLRQSLPPRTVIQQDTDGLYTTHRLPESGTVGGLTLGTLPGQLRLDRVCRYARFWSPKHYYVDGQWVLSGYKTGFNVRSGGVITDRVRVNTATGGHTGIPRHVYEVVRRLPQPVIPTDIRVGDDGWAQPPYEAVPVDVEWTPLD